MEEDFSAEKTLAYLYEKEMSAMQGNCEEEIYGQDIAAKFLL